MMDEKMKAAFEAWQAEYWKNHAGYPNAEKGAEWMLEYLCSQQEPVAWSRKWFIDGEKPQKVRNESNRLTWPAKFKFHAVTEVKCMKDDVGLYAYPVPSDPAAPEGWLAAVEWLDELADRQPSQRDARFTRLLAGQLRAAAPSPEKKESDHD